MATIKQALERIVKDRDFSLAAAEALESEVAKQGADNKIFEELEHILASYRPGRGEFLFDEKTLERECVRVLERLEPAIPPELQQ
jgi:hypothetical protein